MPLAQRSIGILDLVVNKNKCSEEIGNSTAHLASSFKRRYHLFPICGKLQAHTTVYHVRSMIGKTRKIVSLPNLQSFPVSHDLVGG